MESRLSNGRTYARIVFACPFPLTHLSIVNFSQLLGHGLIPIMNKDKICVNQCLPCSDKRVYLVIFIVVNIELNCFPSFAVSDSTQTLHAATTATF